MRSLFLLAVLMVPFAAAHGDGDDHEGSLHITAHDDDGFYFTVEGYEGRNPTIYLEPGSVMSIDFTNEGTEAHNLQFAESAAFATDLIDPGNTTSLLFRVPAEGFTTYWCKPHASMGMQGKVVSNESDLESPGLGLIAPLLAIALVAWRRK